MEKFIPYEKLSKKEKRKQDQARRQTWGPLSLLWRQPSALVASTACFPLWLKICHRHIFLTRRAPQGAPYT